MSVSVLVPFRPDPSGERTRIWQWNERRWRHFFPDWEIVVRSDRGDGTGPFNEGEALNYAARAATGDVFVITESETAFCYHVDLAAPVGYLLAGATNGSAWFAPLAYHMLSQTQTEWVLAGDPAANIVYDQDALIDEPFLRSWYSESVSPPIVLTREAFETVGGYEERYPGWGWIDKVMAVCLDTLWAPMERFPGACYHLEHPRVPARDVNALLSRKYLMASGNPAAVRKLIAGRL